MAKKLKTALPITADYDADGDVLYLSFGPPQPADDAEVTEEGVILRRYQGKLVGITILNAQEQLATPELLLGPS